MVGQQAQQGVELTVKDIWRVFAKIVIGLPRPSRGVGIFGGKIWYQMDREGKGFCFIWYKTYTELFKQQVSMH